MSPLPPYVLSTLRAASVLTLALTASLAPALDVPLDPALLSQAASAKSAADAGEVVGIDIPVKAVVDFGQFRYDAPEFEGGQWTRGHDGSVTWSVPVTSAGAGALRLSIEGFSSPAGGALTIIDSKGVAHGPYTEAGPNGDGAFWTGLLAGDSATLVMDFPRGVYVPASGAGFTISAVANLQAGALAKVGIGCTDRPTAPPCAVTTITPGLLANAPLLFYSRGDDISLQYVATGTLLQGATNPGETRYILTSAYAVSQASQARSLALYQYVDAGVGYEQVAAERIDIAGRSASPASLDFSLLRVLRLGSTAPGYFANSTPPTTPPDHPGHEIFPWDVFSHAVVSGDPSAPGLAVTAVPHVTTLQERTSTLPSGCSASASTAVATLTTGTLTRASLGAPVVSVFGELIGIITTSCGGDPCAPCPPNFAARVTRIEQILAQRVDNGRTVAETLNFSDLNNCIYPLQPAARTLCKTEQVAFFIINADPGCPWSISSTERWINPVGARSGTGPGVVYYSVTAHDDAERVGHIVVTSGADTVGTHTVTQRRGTDRERELVSAIEPAALLSGILTIEEKNLTVDLCEGGTAYSFPTLPESTELVVQLFPRNGVDVDVDVQLVGASGVTIWSSDGYTANEVVVLNASSVPPFVPGAVYRIVPRVSRFTEAPSAVGEFDLVVTNTRRAAPDAEVALESGAVLRGQRLTPQSTIYRMYNFNIPSSASEVIIRTTDDVAPAQLVDNGDITIFAAPRSLLNFTGTAGIFEYSLEAQFGYIRKSDFHRSNDEVLVLNRDNVYRSPLAGFEPGLAGEWVIGVLVGRGAATTYSISAEITERTRPDYTTPVEWVTPEIPTSTITVPVAPESVTGPYQYYRFSVPTEPADPFELQGLFTFGFFDAPVTAATEMTIDLGKITGDMVASLNYSPWLSPEAPPSDLFGRGPGFPLDSIAEVFRLFGQNEGTLFPQFTLADEYRDNETNVWRYAHQPGDLLLGSNVAGYQGFRSVPPAIEFAGPGGNTVVVDATTGVMSFNVRRDASGRGNLVLHPGTYSLGVLRRGAAPVTLDLSARLSFPAVLPLTADTVTATTGTLATNRTAYYAVDVPVDAVALHVELDASALDLAGSPVRFSQLDLAVNRTLPPFLRTGEVDARLLPLDRRRAWSEHITIADPLGVSPTYSLANGGFAVEREAPPTDRAALAGTRWYISVNNSDTTPGASAASYTLRVHAVRAGAAGVADHLLGRVNVPNANLIDANRDFRLDAGDLPTNP